MNGQLPQIRDVGALNFVKSQDTRPPTNVATSKAAASLLDTSALSYSLLPSHLQSTAAQHVQSQQHTNHTQPVRKRPTTTPSVASTPPTSPSYIRTEAFKTIRTRHETTSLPAQGAGLCLWKHVSPPGLSMPLSSIPLLKPQADLCLSVAPCHHKTSNPTPMAATSTF